MIRSILYLIAGGFLTLQAVAQEKVYEITGVVMALRPETQTAVIHHGDVPGLMPTMTMPFSVPSDTEFEALSVDDKVRFEYVMSAAGSHARSFEILGKAERKPGSESNAPTAGKAERREKIEEGSYVLRVPLIDQDGKPTDIRVDDRFTLVTFIFTRCPVPDFCPLMSSQFSKLEEQFDDADLDDAVRLLSITIDPENDTPEVLKEYGKALDADFDEWQFATAKPEVIDQLASDFRIFRQHAGGTLEHTLCTALIAPDGKVHKIWRGNRWTTNEVFAATSKAVAASGIDFDD